MKKIENNPALGLTREQFDRWTTSCPESLDPGLTFCVLELGPNQVTTENKTIAVLENGSIHNLYDSAEAVGRGLSDISLIEQAFEDSGFDNPIFFGAMNRLFGAMVQVDEKDVENKEIVGAIVTQGGFIPKVRVTRPDGTGIITPAMLPGSDKEDMGVIVWTFKDFFANLGARKMALLELEKFAVEDEPLSKNVH